MDRIEFSNFYKFLTSLGLVLIALTIVSQWIFIKELKSFTISSALELPRSSSDYITSRHLTLINHGDKIFFMLFTTGIILSTLGIIGWYPRQKQEDDKQDFEHAKSKLEFEKQKTDEKKIALTEEIQIEEPSYQQHLTSSKTTNENSSIDPLDQWKTALPDGNHTIFHSERILTNENKIQKYFQIEEIAFQQIIKKTPSAAKIYREARFSKSTFDLVIELKNKDSYFYNIYEIKYYSKTINTTFLKQSLEKFLLSSLALVDDQKRSKSQFKLFMIWAYKQDDQEDIIENYAKIAFEKIDRFGFDIEIIPIKESALDKLHLQLSP